MMDKTLFKNIKYYAAYQLVYVVVSILITSLGAFFHFLLNHEISILESWLHNNYWEILIISKGISLFLINHWFTVRLYQLKSIKDLLKELVSFPDMKALTVSVFSLAAFLIIGGISSVEHNLSYWYYHVVAFLGPILFYGIEFVVIVYLDDILNQKHRPSRFKLSLAYLAIFTIGFKLSVPDYYHHLPFVIFCFLTLLYLSDRSFRRWSNVLCYLVLFVAPIGAIFGVDPMWGSDFSPFKLIRSLNLPFLVVVWMISFIYYRYRDQFIVSARKLLR